MPDVSSAVAGREPLLGARLEAVLAEISGAANFDAAARVLADAFAAAVASPSVLVYTLGEGDPTLRLVATAGDPGGGEGGSARDHSADNASDPRAERASLADPRHPAVLAALSLFALGCEGESVEMGAGTWVVVPLPQPMATWSPPPIDASDVAARVSTPRCQIVMLQPGERRRRVGLAPFGVAAVRLPDGTPRSDDRYARVVSALLPAATLAGPILARSQAVERYRETAERLDRQRDLLSEIIDSLPDPVVLIAPRDVGRGKVRPNGDITVLAQNRRAADLLDVARGASDARRRAVELNDIVFSAFLASRGTEDGTGGADGTTSSSELTLVCPDDGSDLLFEVGDHSLGALGALGALASAASPAGVRLLILRDVTALRSAAGQLERQVRRARIAEHDARRERDRLDLLLDYVADPILMTDARADVVEANRQAERLFPVERGAAALGTSGERPSGPALDRMRQNFDAFRAVVAGLAASGDASRRARLGLTHPLSGNALPVEVVSGRVRGGPDEPSMVVSVVHDLTTQVENERLYEELKRFSQVLEARVRAATADLAEQNTQLQWQSRELEKANRLKSEFLASMSHELRTPINALIGYTALILDRVYGELTPKQEEGLRRAQAAAQHLLALINDILDLAKIEAGRMPVHVETVAIAAVAREVSVQADPLARAKRLEFVTDIAPDLPAVSTDATKLTQILLNLVANAIKFTPVGRVTLSARAAADVAGVRFEVEDTGIGIRAEDLEVIWDDFRQLDQSRTREFGGTGLGLSIVKKLADRLGARVGVRSEVGVGSTFWVEVPTVGAADSEPGAEGS